MKKKHGVPNIFAMIVWILDQNVAHAYGCKNFSNAPGAFKFEIYTVNHHPKHILWNEQSDPTVTSLDLVKKLRPFIGVNTDLSCICLSF